MRSELMRRGRLEMIIGPMYSGKTEEMIRRITRRNIAKQNGLILKPSMETRDGKFLKSRSGMILEAIPVKDSSEVLDLVKKGRYDYVALDEIQFFDDGIVDVIEEIVNMGVSVIGSGLNLDFKGEPFNNVSRLAMKADELTLLKAVCVICGRDATRTQRLVMVNGEWRPASKKDSTILVEGSMENVRYEPRCRDCWVIEE
ncbi:MAG: thymidine kinase [Thermotoga sp.]|nr:MAG: thymidine kinase [Thermotoga sp.]